MTQDIKRNFRTVLDLGSGPGHFSKLLEIGKVHKSIMLDSSGSLSCHHISMLVHVRYRTPSPSGSRFRI